MPFRDRYQKIRDKLDEYGFHQPLSVESLSLVGNLLTELESTKESLNRFQDITRLNRDGNAEVEAEIFSLRLENESLIKEKEHLKKKIDEIREEDGKIRKDLRLRVVELENQVSDLEFVNTEQHIRIQELEGEVLKFSTDFINSRTGRNPGGSDPKKLLSNVHPSSYSVLRLNASQEISSLRRDKETLQNALDDYKCQVTEQDQKLKLFLDELKQLRVLNTYQKKPCSCHVEFEGCNHQRKKATNCCNSDESSCECFSSKCQPSNKKPTQDLKNSVAVLESDITNLKKKLESEKTSNEKLAKSLSALKKEKCLLTDKLENLSKAEYEIVQQMNGLFKENIDLRGQLATIQESRKSKDIKGTKTVKNALQSKPVSTNTEKPISCAKSNRVEKENCPDSRKANDIENMVKDQVENCIKNMNVALQSNAEMEEQSKHQFMNSILQERDHFYCQYQKLRNKVCSVTKSLKNIPVFDCPFACLDQISYTICNYEKKIDELSCQPIANQAVPKFQCNCAYTDLSAVIKSYEIKLKEVETREVEAASIKELLTMKLNSTQEENIRFKSRLDALTKENIHLKAKYDQMCLLHEEVERSLRNSEDNKKISEAELNCALSKIKKLECQKAKLESNEVTFQFEKNSLKKNLIQIDKQKDVLTMQLDEKTERVVELETELKTKKSQILELEERLNKVENSLRALQKIHSHSEVNNKKTEKSTNTLKLEIRDLKHQKENLSKDNRRLQDDLSAALQDCVTSNHELSAAKLEIEELKEKLQSYVSEVRRIEDILQSKEDERRNLLDQLKNMNADAFSINSKSLDRSSNIPAEAVADLQDRLLTYEAEVQDKNNMLMQMGEEMDNLKLQVQHLESELANTYPSFSKTKNNFQDNGRISRLEAEREELRKSVCNMREENCRLHENLREAHCSSSIMEDSLSRTRRETMEEASKNKNLSYQVKKLEQMILQLKEQLDSSKRDFGATSKGKKSHKKITLPASKIDRTW